MKIDLPPGDHEMETSKARDQFQAVIEEICLVEWKALKGDCN